MLMDLFEGTPFEVELEVDLSVEQQKLDVLVIRKTAGEMTQALPDGFEDLVNHNL